MGIAVSTVVDASIDDVFAWHSRPGAIVRLSPPWQPVRVLEEAQSLADGRAVLGMPLRLRWVASHDPSGYDPPRCFVDELTSLPLRWRHTHRFTAESPTTTRITDEVASPVPARLLRAMFAYRHRQTADDLASHRQTADDVASHRRAPRPMTIAVTGASGLIGTALTAFLTTGGHRVIRLVRRTPRTGDERYWNPVAPSADLLAGTDAVVHLAGESIAGRFTHSHKDAIRASRIVPTRLLASQATGVFVCASAIGYYGADRGAEILTERSERGEGFLADLVADWETAASVSSARVVQLRTGIVQSPQGGTLRLMRPLFAAGIGGRLGDGQQWLPWIGIDDMVDIYARAIFDADLRGPINAVAPEPVRNVEYTHTLARVMHRPAVLPVPSLGPRLLLGRQGLTELALASQRVVPDRLVSAGHRFRHPDLEGALRHVLGRVASPN